MVLFGKNPIRFIPQSRIRLTLYPTKTSGNQFIDDKIFEGNIFKNITAIFEYLDIVYGKNLTIKGLLRTDKPNYPVLALREGILNAIVHRDYNSVKGFLQISIYSDRTEINHYGALPDGITVADLKVEHNSILRNPDIAQMCFYRKHIEMLGTGTQRMIRDCKENKFKVPVWKQNNNITTVIFPDVAHNRKDKSSDDTVNDTVNDAVNDAVKKGIIDAISDAVNDALIDAVKVIKTNKSASIHEIMESTGKSNATAKRYLQILKEIGLVEFKGAAKTGKYHFTAKAERKLKQ